MNDDRSNQAPPTVAGFIGRVAGHVADALRYWEPRRIIYNAVLAAVVLGHLFVEWPASRAWLSIDTFLGLFFLAVLANLCYCAVYIVDLFVQFSGLHESWARGRVAVLAIGTAFAAVIAHFSTNFLGGK
jgi:hypothetical protein